jgi:DNA-directed RNA polymerase beta' subunit
MINIINVDKFIKDNQLNGPIKSSQLFLGKSFSYHPQGPLSEEIFGIEGSPERRENCSWIDLGCNVIHPMIYDIMNKRIFQKIDKLLNGDKSFTINDEGLLEEDENGEISGMISFVENIQKIKFRKDDNDSDRNKIIKMFEKNIKSRCFFMDKLIVIPPDHRKVNILEETKEVSIDPLNETYQRIITLSYQIRSTSGSLYDVLVYRMQILLKELLDLIRTRVSKKQGMVRNLMLGKRVDFSARTVITPNPELEIGYSGIPLRIIVEIFEPFILYGLTNSPYSKDIPDEFFEEVKKYLVKEKGIDVKSQGDF